MENAWPAAACSVIVGRFTSLRMARGRAHDAGGKPAGRYGQGRVTRLLANSSLQSITGILLLKRIFRDFLEIAAKIRRRRIQVAFDDHRLVANAGLLLPVTLAHHLGLGELVENHVDLGDAPGRANAGDKMVTLVASALAGGDCIDDADALRAGGTDRVLGCVVKAPSD